MVVAAQPSPTTGVGDRWNVGRLRTIPGVRPEPLGSSRNRNPGGAKRTVRTGGQFPGEHVDLSQRLGSRPPGVSNRYRTLEQRRLVPPRRRSRMGVVPRCSPTCGERSDWNFAGRRHPGADLVYMWGCHPVRLPEEAPGVTHSALRYHRPLPRLTPDVGSSLPT